MYQLVIDPTNNKTMSICLDNNYFIPIDESNVEYQKYLVWVAEGNIAEEWNPNGNQ